MDRYTREARNMIDDALRADVGVAALAALDTTTLAKIERFCATLRDRIAHELRAANAKR